MVSLASLDLAEMSRCLLAADLAGGGAALLAWAFGALFAHAGGVYAHSHARLADLVILLAGTTLWAVLLKWALEKTGSALPRVAMKRLGLA